MPRDNNFKTWIKVTIPTIITVLSIPLIILMIIDRSISTYLWVIPIIMLLSAGIVSSWVIKNFDNRRNQVLTTTTILLIMSLLILSTIYVSLQTKLVVTTEGIVLPLISVTSTLISGTIMGRRVHLTIIDDI